MNLNYNDEPNRCVKCNQEIEPQYYYCEKCSAKKRRKDLILAIILTVVILFGASALLTLFKIQLGAIFTLVYYLAVFALISFVWKMYINAEPPLKDLPEENKPKKIIKNDNYIILNVGVDITMGKHQFIATKPNGGFVHISPQDGSEHEKIYVKKKKTIKLNAGDKIKLINCELSNKE